MMEEMRIRPARIEPDLEMRLDASDIHYRKGPTPNRYSSPHFGAKQAAKAARRALRRQAAP